MAVMITLQSGEVLKKYRIPVDVFCYVPEGMGILGIGNERARSTKDTLIESPAKIPHRWINESRALPEYAYISRISAMFPD